MITWIQKTFSLCVFAWVSISVLLLSVENVFYANVLIEMVPDKAVKNCDTSELFVQLNDDNKQLHILLYWEKKH